MRIFNREGALALAAKRKVKRGKHSYTHGHLGKKMKEFIRSLVSTPIEGGEGISETVVETLTAKFAETVKRLDPTDPADRKEIIACVKMITDKIDPTPKSVEVQQDKVVGNPILEKELNEEELAQLEREAAE